MNESRKERLRMEEVRTLNFKQPREMCTLALSSNKQRHMICR